MHIKAIRPTLSPASLNLPPAPISWVSVWPRNTARCHALPLLRSPPIAVFVTSAKHHPAGEQQPHPPHCTCIPVLACSCASHQCWDRQPKCGLQHQSNLAVMQRCPACSNSTLGLESFGKAKMHPADVTSVGVPATSSAPLPILGQHN